MIEKTQDLLFATTWATKEINDNFILVSFLIVKARLSGYIPLDQLVGNRRRFELALTRNVQMAEKSRRRLSMLDVYFARDASFNKTEKKLVDCQSVMEMGFYFHAPAGSFRQLADRYLADWVDATRRAFAARSSLPGPVIDHEFIGV